MMPPPLPRSSRLGTKVFYGATKKKNAAGYYKFGTGDVVGKSGAETKSRAEIVMEHDPAVKVVVKRLGHDVTAGTITEDAAAGELAGVIRNAAQNFDLRKVVSGGVAHAVQSPGADERLARGLATAAELGPPGEQGALLSGTASCSMIAPAFFKSVAPLIGSTSMRGPSGFCLNSGASGASALPRNKVACSALGRALGPSGDTSVSSSGAAATFGPSNRRPWTEKSEGGIGPTVLPVSRSIQTRPLPST